MVPLRLRHVALRVQNFDAMVQFYTEVLGYEREWQPDADNLYLRSSGDNLALHRAERKGEGALDHFGFIVPTEADVDAWAARIRAAGYRLETEVKTHRDGARSFYFRDPDGNLLQVLYHPPISPSL